jgi:hypothetical protein
MSAVMRAKVQVQSVTKPSETCEILSMSAVCGTDPFGPDGESEDNTFARYTPSGSVSLSITNPALAGQFKQGDKLYVDFSRAE